MDLLQLLGYILDLLDDSQRTCVDVGDIVLSLSNETPDINKFIDSKHSFHFYSMIT